MSLTRKHCPWRLPSSFQNSREGLCVSFPKSQKGIEKKFVLPPKKACYNIAIWHGDYLRNRIGKKIQFQFSFTSYLELREIMNKELWNASPPCLCPWFSFHNHHYFSRIPWCIKKAKQIHGLACRGEQLDVLWRKDHHNKGIKKVPWNLSLMLNMQ